MATVGVVSPSKKRALDTDPPSTTSSTAAHPQMSEDDSRCSPAPSTLTSLSATPVPTIEHAPTDAAKSSQPPAKRRKLTPQEKEVQRLEKERKAREKEEQKKVKAEEKRIKEDEKRVRDEERRKKMEELEEKRRDKELKKLQAEQEKEKKERSQLRINAFFIGPKASKPSAESPAKPRFMTKDTATRRSLSMDPGDSSTPTQSHQSTKQNLTDYETFFLPYCLPSNTTLAPHNAQLPPEAVLADIRAKMDEYSTNGCNSESAATWSRVCSDFNITSRPTSVALSRSVQDIMAEINGSAMQPVDLTSETASRSPLQALQSVPMKYLHFGEDVRPPYYGTFTRIQDRSLALKLCRNPVSRSLPDINYDYDSEAEWEEVDDGEDLASNDDEEESVDGDEDMEGFLDDDGAVEPSRARAILGGTELVPVSTGICWQDHQAISRNADTNEVTSFSGLKMGVLLVPRPASIDPYSTAYWEKTSPKPTVTAASLFAKLASTKSPMDPPRLPLTARPNSFLNGSSASPTAKATTAKAVSAAPGQKRFVGPEVLADFKRAIEGSDFTKIALVEDLKKRFPKIPKDAITNTLSLVAERVGPKASEKRWVLRPEIA